MLDHVSLGVSDLDRAVVFYDRVLATLGHTRLWRTERGAGYGISGSDEPFALIAVGETKPDPKLDPTALASWTMVCNEMMNLDEVLNK